jgi:hypothetical protein
LDDFFLGASFDFPSATTGVGGVLAVGDVGDGNTSTPVGEHVDGGTRERGVVDSECAIRMQSEMKVELMLTKM